MGFEFESKGENIFTIKQKKATHRSMVIMNYELKNIINFSHMRSKKEKNILYISFTPPLHAIMEETNKSLTNKQTNEKVHPKRCSF